MICSKFMIEDVKWCIMKIVDFVGNFNVIEVRLIVEVFGVFIWLVNVKVCYYLVYKWYYF